MKNEEAALAANREIIDAYDYMGNACSAGDCTGLIPANPPDAYGRESYEDIYQFLTKPAQAPPRQEGNSAKPGLP